MMRGLLPPRSSKGPRAVSHPTCRSVSFDRCDWRDLLVGLEGDERGSHARCSGTRCCVVQPVGWAPGLRAESHKATGAWSWRSSTRPRPGVPARFRWHNTALDMPRTHLPDGDIPGTRRAGVRTPGASGRPGDPLGDPTVALRRSHHRSWLDNWQPRGIPCGPTSSRACKPHLMTPPASQACRCWGLTRGVWHHQDRRRRGPVSSPASWT